jgi:hypothetical protein
MSTTVAVRFTKAWRTYFPGDVAGFDKEIADALVGGGVASAYTGKPAAAQVDKTAQTAPAQKPNNGKPGNNKRGGASKPETTTPGTGSLLSEAPAGSLVVAESESDEDSPTNLEGGAEGDDNSGAEAGAGGGDGADDDDEKP